MKKLLIGGSPCTHWSIAQKKNRETEPEGLGWELFKNFLIAKDKFKPDFFLYENNKSMAKVIKEQITYELGVEPILINSALVSAQNRQRYYWTNIPDVTQPEDRGVLLRDVLENGEDLTSRDKSYCLTAYYDGAVAWNTLERKQRSMVVESVRVGDLPNSKGMISGSQATRLYSIDGKSVNLVANGGGQGAKTGLYTVPLTTRMSNKVGCIRATYYKCGNGRNLTENFINGRGYEGVIELWDGKSFPVYEVKDGQITIKNKQYPIKLTDGYYIIRKLTPIECERLQTIPDNYTAGVSNTQRYKGLGNGWTAEVIKHILKSANIPLKEEIQVLSMYDGIATGHYCLDSLGYKNITYHAYEIDKYAIQIAMNNYPDIIQHGDAFQVRNEAWKLF